MDENEQIRLRAFLMRELDRDSPFAGQFLEITLPDGTTVARCQRCDMEVHAADRGTDPVHRLTSTQRWVQALSHHNSSRHAQPPEA